MKNKIELSDDDLGGDRLNSITALTIEQDSVTGKTKFIFEVE